MKCFLVVVFKMHFKISGLLNYSLADATVAGCGIIENEHLVTIASLGFTKIICLTEEPAATEAATYGLEYEHYPIVDLTWHPLSEDETDMQVMKEIMASLDGSRRLGEHVVVHCLAGVGRTNTVLACWLIYSGAAVTPDEAINSLTRHRIVSLTASQKAFVQKFHRSCRSA